MIITYRDDVRVRCGVMGGGGGDASHVLNVVERVWQLCHDNTKRLDQLDGRHTERKQPMKSGEAEMYRLLGSLEANVEANKRRIERLEQLMAEADEQDDDFDFDVDDIEGMMGSLQVASGEQVSLGQALKAVKMYVKNKKKR